MRIAAVGDLHCSRTSAGRFQSLFEEASRRADVLALCGDLTQRGLPEEARVLCRDLKAASVPVLAVLGNHDFESDAVDELTAVLEEGAVTLLDGEAWERDDVGFAGVKGFGGGFGERSMAPWGEPAVKSFVAEATREALKLERALASLRTSRRVALLHYAPVAGTVTGEPLELHPFLGSSRLEEPLDRFRVDVTLHGHAHKGAPFAKTRGERPVYNVAMPLLADLRPGPPLLVVELGIEGTARVVDLPD